MGDHPGARTGALNGRSESLAGRRLRSVESRMDPKERAWSRCTPWCLEPGADLRFFLPGLAGPCRLGNSCLFVSVRGFQLHRRHDAQASPQGSVCVSNPDRYSSASSRVEPHMLSLGLRPAQNAGRSGRPKSAHRRSGSSCAHGIPAGLPWGMPGIGEVIEGAMQHAPQLRRQSMKDF